VASSVATDKVAANWFIKNYDHDPAVDTVLVLSADGGTTQKWIDLRDYDHVAYLAVPTAGTGPNITLFEIIASETETTTNAVQIKTSGAVVVTALTGGESMVTTAMWSLISVRIMGMAGFLLDGGGQSGAWRAAGPGGGRLSRR
jgi:hypothetical protein